MYADVHFLGGKLVTVREVDVTTKAHPILSLRQHHEGVCQPLVIDLGVVSKPSQTFLGVITMIDSSSKDSCRLGVSNLQE